MNFDQFQQHSQQTAMNNISRAEISSGIIEMNIEPEIPIFTKTRKNFTPSDKITHAAIANKYLVVAMADNMLFRVDYRQKDQHDVIPLSKFTKSDRLTNIYLDPSGNHLLLNFVSQTVDISRELMYLPKNSTKLKSMAKLKGQEISEVGWNYSNFSESSTGPILLGTSKGLIFETEISSTAESAYALSLSQIPTYLKQVFDVGKGKTTPITGLEFHQVENKRCFIFATTLVHLYYFTGYLNSDEKPQFQQIFNRYLSIPETFIEVHGNNVRSRLKFWSNGNSTIPTSFAWITDKEMLYWQFDYRTCTDISTLKDTDLKLPYPLPQYLNPAVLQKAPFALVLTEFHVLLAYSDRIKAISVLNQELVYEDQLSESCGRLINLVKDPLSGAIWAIAENSIYKLAITREERNVWRIYCEKEQFELAKRYSQGNLAHRNIVLIKEANMLFKCEEFGKAAEIFAETESSFEEICLRFIEIEKFDALEIYLRKKLDNLNESDKTQITMIVIWVVELYLDQLEEFRLAGKELTHAYTELQKQLDKFLMLPVVSNCIKKNRATIYDLMDSHGDRTNSVQLTIINEDFETLIRQNIYKNNYHNALKVLNGQGNKTLFYQFALILLNEVPALFVNALIQQGRNLLPLKLLPALINHKGEQQAQEVIKYLEFCVDKLKTNEKSIHNFLLSLYVKYNETKLMRYLDLQGKNIIEVKYDVNFALHLCREKDIKPACVHLSCLLGLWESSVDLALQIDESLAKEIANLVDENDVELRKKLWLKIAKHVVSGENDIKKAMKFLQQCDLIRIEDILPFCSDFETIDHFKTAICNSLKEYNQHMQDLKDEMEEATKSSEQVREEIQTFRNRHTIIKYTDTCDICDRTLLIRPLYMFPCMHKFHMDCLLSELTPTLGIRKQTKLDDLHKQLNAFTLNPDNLSTASGMSVKDIQGEIDNIIASECLYCGEAMIRNIDTMFIDENDYERVLKEWE